jgi:hypothetical protein
MTTMTTRTIILLKTEKGFENDETLNLTIKSDKCTFVQSFNPGVYFYNNERYCAELIEGSEFNYDNFKTFINEIKTNNTNHKSKVYITNNSLGYYKMSYENSKFTIKMLWLNTVLKFDFELCDESRNELCNKLDELLKWTINYNENQIKKDKKD